MAGPQYTKSSRSTSQSPKLSKIHHYKNENKSNVQQSQQTPPKQNLRSSSCSPQKFSPSFQHGKRKSPARNSPPPSSRSASQKAIPLSVAVSSSSPVIDMESLSLAFAEALEDCPVAVPKVAAMPPQAQALPVPPNHWFGIKCTQCPASKQQCRVVTRDLMSHLATSGILVSAQ